MPCVFTWAQADENRAFLEVLAATGNARLAAREIKRAPATMHNRRTAHAGFAQQWEAAIAAAHARFHLAGGKRGPESLDMMKDSSCRGARKGDPGLCRDDGRGLRTRGGEPMVVRTKNGKLQLRPAHRGKLNRAAEQAFLRALSASANVRLSAAAAGASPRAFYRRQRQNPAFAREMRLALRMGYERLEAAALQAALPESHEDDAWRRSEPPPLPRMSVDQALQLLFLHQKSVRLGWDMPHRRRRRGESDDVYSKRLGAMWISEKRREAEDAALRRAARFEESGDWRFDDERPLPELPRLELVTGWSRASGKPKHNPDVALFGGWRLKEMEARLAGKG